MEKVKNHPCEVLQQRYCIIKSEILKHNNSSLKNSTHWKNVCSKFALKHLKFPTLSWKSINRDVKPPLWFCCGVETHNWYTNSIFDYNWKFSSISSYFIHVSKTCTARGDDTIKLFHTGGPEERQFQILNRLPSSSSLVVGTRTYGVSNLGTNNW